MEDLEKEKLLNEIQHLKQEVAVLKKKLNSGGRPQKLDSDKKHLVEQYRSEGKTVKEISKELNCSMSTINRVLKKQKNNKKTEKAVKSDNIRCLKIVEQQPIQLKRKFILD